MWGVIRKKAKFKGVQWSSHWLKGSGQGHGASIVGWFLHQAPTNSLMVQSSSEYSVRDIPNTCACED